MSYTSILHRIIASLIVMASLTVAVSAHEVKAGPNGGPLTDLGDVHLELVMKTNMISLFVTDAAGAAVDVSAASASLIILAGTKKHAVKLNPVADNVLGDSFAIPDAGPYTVIAIVSIPGKKPLQGRFEVSALLAFLGNKSQQKS